KAPFNDPANPLNLFQWHHQPFAYFDNYAPLSPGGQAHLQAETRFFADLAAGDLPSVSFIKPLGPDNEHRGYASLLQGQQHVDASSLESRFHTNAHPSLDTPHIQPNADNPAQNALLIRDTAANHHTHLTTHGPGIDVTIKGEHLNFDQTSPGAISRIEVYAQ